MQSELSDSGTIGSNLINSQRTGPFERSIYGEPSLERGYGLDFHLVSPGKLSGLTNLKLPSECNLLWFCWLVLINCLQRGGRQEGDRNQQSVSLVHLPPRLARC